MYSAGQTGPGYSGLTWVLGKWPVNNALGVNLDAIWLVVEQHITITERSQIGLCLVYSSTERSTLSTKWLNEQQLSLRASTVDRARP